MSKENMSKKNILDYDEEKTIRPQNFTLTAMKEFYDTIESDQFQGASEDTIYKYLTNIMDMQGLKKTLIRSQIILSCCWKSLRETIAMIRTM